MHSRTFGMKIALKTFLQRLYLYQPVKLQNTKKILKKGKKIMKNIRLAIDVGGTFTDVFVFNEETKEVFVTKTSSTPSRPELGILQALEKSNLKGTDIKIFSHGTTVGTNALIERKLPKT